MTHRCQCCKGQWRCHSRAVNTSAIDIISLVLACLFPRLRAIPRMHTGGTSLCVRLEQRCSLANKTCMSIIQTTVTGGLKRVLINLRGTTSGEMRVKTTASQQAVYQFLKSQAEEVLLGYGRSVMTGRLFVGEEFAINHVPCKQTPHYFWAVSYTHL